MKVLGIIPARYASSRFPGKPLVDIKGKSMIQRVYEQSKKSSKIDKVVVATDDLRIIDEVKSFGGDALMTSENHKNGTERCGEVVQSFADYDVIINIQGDEPLIQPEQLDKVIGLFTDENVDIGTLAKKIVDTEAIENPNRVKVVFDKNNFALYFSRSPIPYSFDIGSSQHPYYKHIGIYAWKKEVLKELVNLPETAVEKSERLEQLRWMFNGYKIKVAETKIETPNVDTPEDLEEVIKLI